MKAIVDPDICIGCTLCTQICPDVYEMRGDKAVTLTDPVPSQFENCAKDGADQCPVNAIIIQ